MQPVRRSLDEDQNAAVRCMENAVVAAGAGSGKTSVLAERYLHLVLNNLAEVERLLTLTFTRKAAAEMHQRIYRLLLEHQDHPHVSAQLARFEYARISTLDSFCTQVLRSCSERFGIAASFSTDEARVRELCETTALQTILRFMDRPGVRAFVSTWDLDQAWRGLAGLGAGSLGLAEVPDYGQVLGRQHEVLRGALDQALRSLEDVAAQVLALPATECSQIEEARAVLSGLGRLRPLAATEDYADLAGGCQEMVGLIEKPRGNAKKDRDVREAFKELVDLLRATGEELQAIAATLESKEFLGDLLDLTKEYHAALNQAKRRQGLLSFQDVMELAVKALSEDRTLRGLYKAAFSHIMIDEFQDNNELQKRLLYLLAERREAFTQPYPGAAELEPGRLFFVGDEKQSIYRFRDADVRVFKQLSRELEVAGGRFLRLRTNYRSEPGLVSFFNDLFGAVMGEAAADHEAVFSPLSPRPGEDSLLPQVRVLVKPPRPRGQDAEGLEDEAASDDAEAYAICTLLRGWVEEGGLQVGSGGGPRGLAYDDVALLLRSGGNQYRYERMFRRFGIPYTVQGTRSLFLEAPVNDMYSLLQLAVFPEDRLAYATLLRSPFVNLSDEGVMAVLGSKAPPFQGLELPEPDAGRYRRGAGLYGQCVQKIDVLSPAEVLSWLWYEAGYRYVLLRHPGNHHYLEQYDYLVELARLNAGTDMAAFLGYLRRNLGRYERLEDVELLRDRDQGVRIMTIHKSKGLEFPLVVLANAGNTGRNEGEGTRPVYFSQDFGPCFSVPTRHRSKTNYLYRREQQREKDFEAAELKRLLYVACTRAGSHLVISGCPRDRGRPEESLLGLTLRGLGLDLTEERLPEAPKAGSYNLQLVRIPEVSEREIKTGAHQALALPLESALRIYAEATPADRRPGRREFAVTELQGLWEALEDQETAGEDRPEVAERLPGLEVDEVLTRHSMEPWFGTACHALLEHRFRRGNLGGPLTGPDLLPRALVERCPYPAGLDALSRAAAGLAEGFFRSSLGAGLAGATLESELPFLAAFDTPAGRIRVRGSIDLVVRTPARVLVVDFKTDRYLRPRAHSLQVAMYAEAARELFGGPVEALLFYLRGARPQEPAPLELPRVFERLFSEAARSPISFQEADGQRSPSP